MPATGGNDNHIPWLHPVSLGTLSLAERAAAMLPIHNGMVLHRSLSAERDLAGAGHDDIKLGLLFVHQKMQDLNGKLDIPKTKPIGARTDVTLQFQLAKASQIA